MTKSQNKSGFTLIEILISVAIIAVTITAMAFLLIMTIRANNANMNTLQAYYLSEQGLEAMRNMRDGNWLQNYGWNMGEPMWGENFECDELEAQKYYIVDENYVGTFEVSRFGGMSFGMDIVPWELTEIAGPEFSDTKLYELEEDAGYMRFAHDSTGEESLFSRYILVEYDAGCDYGLVKVTSVVEWFDIDVEREISLSTYLTDWQTL